MKRPKGRNLQTLTALVLASLWAAALGLAHVGGDMWFLERVEATMTDIRMLLRGEKEAPEAVTIIAIDDDLVAREGGYPVSRGTLARIVESIARLEPKLVAVDILLLDPGPGAEDEALARALSMRPGVIAAAAVFAEGEQHLSGAGDDPTAALPVAERFLLPLKSFTEVAAIGIVNVAADRTGTPRFMPMLFRSDERIEASLPLPVASVAAGEDPVIEADRVLLGQRSIRTDFGHTVPVSFYGPRGTITTIGASVALDGRLPRASIEDRVVVLGATVTGGGDVFPTPFDSVLPGVEVVSTVIANLVTGDGIVRDRSVRLADAGFAVALAMLVVGLLAWRRSAISLAMIAGVILVWLVFNVVAFTNGIWLSLALPMTAAGPPAILFGAAQLWLGRRRAQYFADQSALLQQFHAPGMGKWLVRHPDFLKEPVRMDVAVVFIDISGFNGFSQTVGPDATRDLLNEFHALVDEVVDDCGGVVTGFMGDGAMILFGLPERALQDAFNAARCCVGLADRAATWLAVLPVPPASRIGFKIGAHFGAIVASRLGGSGHQHIAATGDTVNVASRLMEVAAEHGVEVALSEELLRAAGRDCAFFKGGYLTGPMQTAIRGRSGSLATWLWQGPFQS